MQPTRETPQPQPPFRRPLRPGFDAGNRRPAAQTTAKRWPWNRLPTSMIINFAALLALFGIVYALQSMGARFGASEPVDTPAATSTSVAALPALPAAESAPETATDLAAPVPSSDDSAAAAPAAAAPQQVYTLPQPPAVAALPAPAEEQPRIDARKTAAAKRKAVAEQRQRQAWTEDREVSVDALDNESARHHYLSANNGTASPAPQEVAPARSRPQPLPAAKLPHASEERTPASSSINDLDGEGARQRYLTENRRTPQDGVGERTERRATAPRSADEYIPYEQGR